VVYRYQRARLNILSKQIEDGQQLKKQLIDQMSDLQKQLKAEREDNKALKKR
jgi:predicted transcriptional regulator